MKYTIILILLLIVGCGKNKYIHTETKDVKTEYRTNFIKQDYEGLYYFDNNSCMEIIVNYNNEISIIKENQTLISFNNDNTLAIHPIIYISNVNIVNNKIKWTQNIKYTVSNSIKDNTDNIIIGTKRTSFTLELLNFGYIKLTIEIIDNINDENIVLTKREFISID
jgi:hypothetical protein